MSNLAKQEFPEPKSVRVCKNRTCKQQGAIAVLNAFQSVLIPHVTVTPSGCLGQCGNGPMVLILPEKVWYSRVKPEQVLQLIQQHLLDG
jgi:(2Fe-2S) ferredoxin